MNNKKPESKHESVSLKVADDAVPLCPNCLEPCDPLANYCPNCGSNDPINPLASYMPFVDLRFRVGMIVKLWQKIWDSKTLLGLRIFGICLFLITMPLLFIIALPFGIVGKFKSKKSVRPEQDSEF